MFVSRVQTSIDHRRVLVALAAATAALWAAAPANADLIFAVNNAGDRADADPGDNSCDAAPAITGEQCSLRAAIEETNAVPGGDAIRFAIPGTGVQKITPDTALPVITGPVEINGYSQAGAKPNTNDLSHPDNAVLKIELSGQDAGSVTGLQLDATGSVVRGLVVNRFSSGITLWSPATVTGSFLGTNPTGAEARAIGFYGIYVDASGGIVGGTHPADRNVISGAGSTGLYAEAALTAQGNFIGTAADGASPLGNHGPGIGLGFDPGHNVIGGAGGAANVIAFNQRAGIMLYGDQTPSRFSRNRIFANDGLGIDLNDDGITPNDPSDADTGPNELQNFPVLTRAVSSVKATTINGALSSSPKGTCTVEFFASPKGSGRQGKRFIGRLTVGLDGDGKNTFTFRPSQRVPVGQQITATATNINGSTSEFSAPRVVTAP